MEPNHKEAIDTQTQRVYDWEDEYVYSSEHNNHLSLSACRELVNIVWEDYYPNETPPIVMDGCGSKYAQANRDYVCLPRWSRNSVIVLHEVTHSFIAYKYGADNTVGHGPNFVRMYIELLHRYDDVEFTRGYLERTAQECAIEITINRGI